MTQIATVVDGRALASFFDFYRDSRAIMHFLTNTIVAVLFLLLPFTISQAVTSLDASSCGSDSPLTTFSACNWLYGQVSYCGSPQVASGAPALSCFCNQNVFNAIY